MATADPRFSILLPTHDRADVVGYAIRSVLMQTQPDFELLVVGDGCTDDTASVVQGFGDPRIRWYDLPKAPGFGYANRNLVLMDARGDLVAFMAHDDLALPDHLELMGTCFEDDRVEWAYSRPVWVADDGLMIPFAVDLRRPSQLRTFFESHNVIPASCVVYRRGLHGQVGYWNEEAPSAADHDLWIRMLARAGGANVAYQPRATTLHFRAHWRTGSWGPPPLSDWLRMAGADDAWPRSLCVEVPYGTAPQAATWAAVQQDSAAWSEHLRTGIASALDALAWEQAVAQPALVRLLRDTLEGIITSGKPLAALELADRALEHYPDEAWLLLARGHALRAADDLAAAETAIRRATELEPESGHFRGQLSQVLLSQGRLDAALEEAWRAVDLRPESAGLQAHLGRLLLRAGRPAEARAALAEALRIEAGLDGVQGLIDRIDQEQS